jgi:hypothetical protein
LVAAAVASLILLPLSQSFADNDRGSFERSDGGLQMAQRGEEAPGQVATYSRANYVWPHATGPFYGARGKGTSRAPGLLQISVGTFDLTQKKGQLGIPAALKTSNRLGQLGAQYFIVQLDPASVPNGSLGFARRAIEDNGGAIVRTLPVMALVARLTPAAMADLDGTPGLLAIEPAGHRAVSRRLQARSEHRPCAADRPGEGRLRCLRPRSADSPG